MKKIVLIKNKKSKKGFFFLELLFVLGIIVVLVVVVFIVYFKVQVLQRVQVESNNIVMIQVGVKVFFIFVFSFIGLINFVVVQVKIFLDNMLSGFGLVVKFINVFKGDVILVVDKIGLLGVDGFLFIIIYLNVFVFECIKIIIVVVGNFYMVGVGMVGNVKVVGGVLNVVFVVIECDKGGNSNKLIFMFI